jgi:hypothetical protein
VCLPFEGAIEYVCFKRLSTYVSSVSFKDLFCTCASWIHVRVRVYVDTGASYVDTGTSPLSQHILTNMYYASSFLCVLLQRILTNTIPPRPNARNRPPKPLLLPFLPSFSSASPTPTPRHICKVLLVASQQKMPPPHPPPPPMPPPPQPPRQEPRGDQLARLLCSLLWRTPSLDG